jgi:hypothetical protein
MNENMRKKLLKSIEVFFIGVILYFVLMGVAHIYYKNVYCEVMTPEQYIMYQNFSDNYTVGIYGNLEQLTYFYNYSIGVFPDDYSYNCGLLNKKKLVKNTDEKIFFYTGKELLIFNKT